MIPPPIVSMLLLALLAPLWTDGQLPSPDLYAVVDRPHANKSGTPPYPQVYSAPTITRWNRFTLRNNNYQNTPGNSKAVENSVGEYAVWRLEPAGLWVHQAAGGAGKNLWAQDPG